MSFIPGNTGVASSFPDGFLVTDGSVTAPTFKFADSQTGFYRPGLNQFALSSNGVQSWLVSAAGAWSSFITTNAGLNPGVGNYYDNNENGGLVLTATNDLRGSDSNEIFISISAATAYYIRTAWTTTGGGSVGVRSVIRATRIA